MASARRHPRESDGISAAWWGIGSIQIVRWIGLAAKIAQINVKLLAVSTGFVLSSPIWV
jgi:hypothetical protein